MFLEYFGVVEGVSISRDYNKIDDGEKGRCTEMVKLIKMKAVTIKAVFSTCAAKRERPCI
jgi:hypothetical protein